jgi:hypothetical protein
MCQIGTLLRSGVMAYENPQKKDDLLEEIVL